jgi:hypothetical protein
MTKPFAHFLTGSVYDLMLMGLFFLGGLALAAYVLFRVFAGRGARGRVITITDEWRSEPTDESRDGSGGA